MSHSLCEGKCDDPASTCGASCGEPRLMQREAGVAFSLARSFFVALSLSASCCLALLSLLHCSDAGAFNIHLAHLLKRVCLLSAAATHLTLIELFLVICFILLLHISHSPLTLSPSFICPVDYTCTSSYSSSHSISLSLTLAKCPSVNKLSERRTLSEEAQCAE